MLSMHLQERTSAAYYHGWLLGFIFKCWCLNRQRSRVINPKGKPLCLNLFSLHSIFTKEFLQALQVPGVSDECIRRIHHVFENDNNNNSSAGNTATMVLAKHALQKMYTNFSAVFNDIWNTWNVNEITKSYNEIVRM